MRMVFSLVEMATVKLHCSWDCTVAACARMLGWQGEQCMGEGSGKTHEKLVPLGVQQVAAHCKQVIVFIGGIIVCSHSNNAKLCKQSALTGQALDRMQP